MKLCPNCCTENQDDVKFCKNCGTCFFTKEEESNKAPLEVSSASFPSSASASPIDYLIDKLKEKFAKSDKAEKYKAQITDENIMPQNIEEREKSRDQFSKSDDVEYLPFSEWIKQPFTVLFFVAFIFIIFLIWVVNLVKSSPKSTSLPSYSYSNYTSSLSLSSELAPTPIIEVSESDIIEIDYNYLAENYERFKDSDKHFKIAGKITKNSSYQSHSLSFKTEDGNEVSADFQPACALVYYKKDTYVTLVGKYCTGGYSFLSLSDAYIVESGDEAEQTYQRLKAEGDKLRAADAKAEKEKAKKAKKDYIASCKTYKYKDIARNPDKYNGKRAKFKGEVVQVIEGYLSTTLRVDVTKGKYGIYTDTMYVVYTPKSTTENRILEDDIITIYGELAGIETYETVMGAKVSIPRIDAEYITINSK